MGTIGSILAGIGGIIALVGGIMFLIVVFKDSVGWGIGCLLLAPLSLVYLCMNFQSVKKAFFISLGGNVLAGIGYALVVSAAVDSVGGVDGIKSGLSDAMESTAPVELPAELPSE